MIFVIWKLRVLCLTNSAIAELPKSICRMTYLRYISIRNSRLSNLRKGIQKLTNLIYLDVSGCQELTSLPPEIGELISLSYLNLSRCSKLKSIPPQIGRLCNLSLLDISGCRELTSLPPEIGNLINLSHLNMRMCSQLESIPQQIGQLRNLSFLDIPCCQRLVINYLKLFAPLNNSVQKIDKTGDLSEDRHYQIDVQPAIANDLFQSDDRLNDSSDEEITNTILKMDQAEDYSETETLPDDRGDEIKVQTKIPEDFVQSHDWMEGTSKDEFPRDDYNEEITKVIRKRDEKFSHRCELRFFIRFDLLGTKFHSEILFLSDSTKLEQATDIVVLALLKSLEALSEPLITLTLPVLWACTQLDELPENIGQLLNRPHLRLSGFSQLTKMSPGSENLSGLSTFDTSFSKILEYLKRENVNLVDVAIDERHELRHLYLCRKKITRFLGYTVYLHNIVRLILKECSSLMELPESLGQLKVVRHIDLSGTKITSLFQSSIYLDNLESLILNISSYLLPSLVNLIHLEIKGGCELQASPHESLQELKISGFMGFDFPYWLIGSSMYLRRLKVLKLINCIKCNSLSTQDATPSLEQLVVSNCPLLEILLLRLPLLSHLKIRRCRSVDCMKDFSFGSVKELTLLRIQRFGSMFLAKIRESIHANAINLSGHFSLPNYGEDITPTFEGMNVQFLDVKEHISLKHLPHWVCYSDSIKSLSIQGCPTLKTLSLTGYFPATLLSLEIDGCSELTSISPRGTLPIRLEKLAIYNCPKLKFIANKMSDQLQSLDIRYCSSLKNLSSCDSLVSLRITGCDLEMLKSCKFSNLKHLDLTKCPSCASFPPEKMNMMYLSMSLTSLILEGFLDLKVLSSSPHLQSLIELSIGRCPMLEWIPEGWFSCSLKMLKVWDCPLIESELYNIKKAYNITIMVNSIELRM